MASYLTESAAEQRLDGRFGIAAAPLQGDIDLASGELDAMGPFIGTKLVTDGTQELAFPRSVNPDGTTNAATTVPAAVLDWVVLSAYRIASDDAPAVTSESAGSVSVSYAFPKSSKAERRLYQAERDLQKYLLKVGQRVGTRPYTPQTGLDW